MYLVSDTLTMIVQMFEKN